jgi:4-hydroxybenzoate polyprenyltransferase/phosphoserine phosphatase
MTDAVAQPGPLVVDIDGTLLRTDLLYESVAALLRRNPLMAVMLPVWLSLGGKAGLKRRLTEHATVDVEGLPANEPFVDWLRGQKAAGRTLALFSASDQRLADQVAARFDLFDRVLGSDGVTNRAGTGKLAAIREAFGDQAVYAGDSKADLAVWPGCAGAVLVGPDTEKLRSALPPDYKVEASFPAPRPSLKTWVKALRLHQWAKNGLIFVAPLLAGLITQPQTLAASLLGFLVFGLLASATYLLNDLIDLPEDRRHRSKRHRPLAAGALPLSLGLTAAPALFLAAAVLSSALPGAFALTAGAYLAVTLAYSLRIKREPIIDVVVLAGLFTIRIAAGVAAAGTEMTAWLLTFSMFFFLSLAAIKRYTECRAMAEEGKTSVAGRGYRAADAPWLMSMGAAAGFCSTLVFFIYLVDASSPMRHYATPQWLWAICVILAYWLSRVWLLAGRGEMNDDPVLFAVKDRTSWLLGGLIVLTVIFARL